MAHNDRGFGGLLLLNVDNTWIRSHTRNLFDTNYSDGIHAMTWCSCHSPLDYLRVPGKTFFHQRL